MIKIETHRFWLGTILLIAGVVMLFIAMYIEPQGRIDGTILGAFGEIATIAGAILGLDSYVSMKMKKILRQEEEKKLIENNE